MCESSIAQFSRMYDSEKATMRNAGQMVSLRGICLIGLGELCVGGNGRGQKADDIRTSNHAGGNRHLRSLIDTRTEPPEK